MRSLPLTLAAMLVVVALSSAQPPATNKPDAKTKADPKAKTEAAAEGKFKMDLKVADVVLGSHLMGPKVSPGDLKGRVVLVDYWGVNCGPCRQSMPATAVLNAELADFGLTILGAHVQDAMPQQIKSVASSLGANFAIMSGTHVKNDGVKAIPHCILFDHTGACVFRGFPAEAEPYIRIALGKALVEGAGREKFSAALSPIVQDLKAGKSPLLVLPRLASLQNSVGEAGMDAKALLGSLTAIGKAKFDQAVELKDSNPAEAFFLIEKLPTAYKGTEVAKSASALIVTLKKDKAVVKEIAARPSLVFIHKIEDELDSKREETANLNLKKEEFMKANAPLIKLMKDKISAMKKAWPDAKATVEAVAVGEKFDIK